MKSKPHTSRLCFKVKASNKDLDTINISISHLGHKNDVPAKALNNLTNVAGNAIYRLAETQGVPLSSISILLTYTHQ